ncbi:MAG: hypothetical protein HY544_03575 [Candidatus Diapherotrites archaeon]|uniref:DUF3887 domain-containing protein n=1 Tax=Candidatus Iainarchaeum sp. TaxID=3101447 RepID=A0A8T3YLL7_9ARCH|nr:hypothetical protein [Candidatus Diapherotrites archaeon]
MKKAIALLLLFGLLAGCGGSGDDRNQSATVKPPADLNAPQDQNVPKADANAATRSPADRNATPEQLADEFFSAVRAKDFDAAVTLAGKSFFDGYTKEQFRGLFDAISTGFGELESYELVSSAKIGGKEGMERTKIVYHVTYSRADANETLIIAKAEGKEGFELAGISVLPGNQKPPAGPPLAPPK